MILSLLFSVFLFGRLEARILAATPPAWWAWFDQHQYLVAAQAFAHGDWAPDHHWYPPGYSMMAAPFIQVLPRDPFVLINLSCLIMSLLACAHLGKTLGLPLWVGAVTFFLTSVVERQVLRNYALPWTTTTTGTFILIALCLCFLRPKPTYSALIGLMIGLILLIKPVDDVALLPATLFYVRQVFGGDNMVRSWRDRVVVLQPGVYVFLFFALASTGIHFVIYGPHLSAYEAMTTSGPVFLPYKLAFRIYNLFIDPTVIFGSFHQSRGLGVAFPWIGFGLLGMILASFQKNSYAALVASVLSYTLLYTSYFDLTPYNAWYGNVWHYFVWTLPLFGLFAVYLVTNVTKRRIYLVLAPAMLLLFFIVGLRPDLRRLDANVSPVTYDEVTINMRGCKAPCVVDLATDGTVINQQSFGTVGKEGDLLYDVTLTPQTVTHVKPRSWFIFLHENGYRFVFLDTNDLTTATFVTRATSPVRLTGAELFEANWRFMK